MIFLALSILFLKLFKNASLSPWQHIESRYQSSHQEFLNNFTEYG